MRKPQLTAQQQVELGTYLKLDRQWRREHRLGYARLMLKFAHAKQDAAQVEFFRAVIQANTL